MSRSSRTRPVGRRTPAARKLRLGAPGGIFAIGRVEDPRVYAAGAADLPGLSMPEPEDHRRVLISSALSALLHILVIGAIAFVGYLAKQVVEEVIPVTIFNEPIELPGSNQPSPLAVPKLLSAPMASAVPLAIHPSQLSAVPAPAVIVPNLDLATPLAPPKPLELAEIMSAPLAVQADTRPTPSAADIREIQPLEISAADLVAPKIEIGGPTQTADRTATNLAAPKAFESLSELNATAYRGAASAVPRALRGIEGAGPSVVTGVSSQFMAAGAAGGDPNAVATVPCLQSAFVQRYLDEIEQRTQARWELPMDSSPEDFVVFRIAIDHSGSIAKLERLEASTAIYAQSATTAFRSAAPFPPLNANIRCLSERTFKLTFRNPERS